MNIEIRNRFNGKIIIAGEYADIRAAVRKAKAGANLSGADLSGANLSGADLSGADLSGADLCGANLSGADLCGADLSGADLRSANPSGANLRSANLSGANLRSADLSGADLRGANLRSADLCGANLSGADLCGATNITAIANAQSSILPEVGQFVGWKKCKGGILVKVMIGKNAKRSNATGRKCRAEYVKVLEVIGAEVGVSSHDNRTEYRTGKIVRCDNWNTDRWAWCGGGIHFFLTRVEAENY
jgi:Family of unknown function (DUF5758)/Pentapeptide repeats (8 copies)